MYTLERFSTNVFAAIKFLKGCCTVYEHALESLEITGIVLSQRMSKNARNYCKGLKKFRNLNFNYM